MGCYLLLNQLVSIILYSQNPQDIEHGLKYRNTPSYWISTHCVLHSTVAREWDQREGRRSCLCIIVKSTYCYTNYGRPMKPFFHQNPELLCLGRQIGQVNSRALGYFRPNCQRTRFSKVSPLFMFSIIQPLFLQKLSLYM